MRVPGVIATVRQCVRRARSSASTGSLPPTRAGADGAEPIRHSSCL
jgi:hypothetical protein